MANIVSRLVDLGTSPEFDPERNRISRLINKIGLIYIGVVIPNIFLAMYFKSVPAIIEQVAGISLMAITLYLNSRGYFSISRYFVLIIGNLHIFSMSFILGMEGCAHYYFPAALVAPLFFFSPKEYRSIVLFTGLAVTLTATTSIVQPSSDWLFPNDPLLIRIFFYSSLFGSQIVIFLYVLHFYFESISNAKIMAALNMKLMKLSKTDSLTKLPNKGSVSDHLKQEWKKARRTKTEIAVIMIDLDNFKLYNDTYGHLEGDEVLVKIADVLNLSIREYFDFPGRFGGEEFIVIMSNSDLDTAESVAERIRSGIVDLAIPHVKNGDFSTITCSCGVSSCFPDDSLSREVLIQKADKALYQAKESGRNRVCREETL